MAKSTTRATANADEGKKAGAADDNATGPNVPATGLPGTATGEGAQTDAASPGAPDHGGQEGSALPPADAATADGGRVDRTGWPELIFVRGPERGRWRAGQHFTLEPKPIELADLTDDELIAIEADPELTIIRAE